MKNLIKKSALVVAVLITTLSVANEDKTFSVNANAEKTTVTIKNVEQGQQLSIIDNNNIVIYKERITKKGLYHKVFDLTALPDGNYYFELNKDLAIHTIPFNVIYNQVTFEKAKETIVYKPSVRVKDNLVLVSQLSLDKSPLNIELLFDKNNTGNFELIHEDKLTDAVSLEKIYKLSENEKGNYKLIFTTEGRVFEKKFNF